MRDAHHPKAPPHAYLWFLGVRPDAQGLGVGSRLLAAGLATATGIVAAAIPARRAATLDPVQAIRHV